MGLVTYSLKYTVCYFPFPVTILIILWKKVFLFHAKNSLLFSFAQILHTKIKGGRCLSLPLLTYIHSSSCKVYCSIILPVALGIFNTRPPPPPTTNISLSLFLTTSL